MGSNLPIEEIREALGQALRAGEKRIVIEAPTGSGKSTQIPQMLLEGGFLGEKGQAVILQPRRIAARMLAKRVAEERGVELGAEVGYTIRLDDQTSGKTRIRFVTEGVLVRQMISRPKLEGVQAVICDEFHERHLYGDLTLGRILDLQEGARPDLLLVVMSATLETEKLAERFGAVILRSEGRMFPVEMHYLEKREDLSGSGAAEVAAGGEKLRRCVLAGFSDHLGRRIDGGTLRCRLSGGRSGTIARESVVRDRSLILAAEMKEIGRTDGEVDVVLGLVTAVKEEWLKEMFPGDFSEKSGLIFEENGRRVLQVEQKRFRDLVLEEKKKDVESSPAAAAVLAGAVLEGKCAWPGWSTEADGLLERLEVVRGWSDGVG